MWGKIEAVKVIFAPSVFFAGNWERSQQGVKPCDQLEEVYGEKDDWINNSQITQMMY